MREFRRALAAVTVDVLCEVTTARINFSESIKNLIRAGVEMRRDVILQLLYESLRLFGSGVGRPDLTEFREDILQYAEDHQLITYCDEDVIRKVRAPKNLFISKKKNPEQEIYFPDELTALRQYCVDHPDPYTRCILLESIVGERAGELCPIKVEDIDLDNLQIAIRRTETREYLNGKQKDTVREGTKTEAGERLVSIPETARDFVIELIRIAEETGGEYLFKQEPGRFKERYVGERIRSRQLRRHLKAICEKLGITYKPPHKLRKTYASILREGEIDDQTIIDMMGHVNIGITEQYYMRSRKKASERSQILGQVAESQIPKPSESKKPINKP